MEDKKIVALMFDGAVHTCKSVWQGIDVITDEPVEGIKELIEELRETYKVILISVRCKEFRGAIALRNYLEKHSIEVDNVVSEIPTNVDVIVGNNTICFDGNTVGLAGKIQEFMSRPKK